MRKTTSRPRPPAVRRTRFTSSRHSLIPVNRFREVYSINKQDIYSQRNYYRNQVWQSAEKECILPWKLPISLGIVFPTHQRQSKEHDLPKSAARDLFGSSVLAHILKKKIFDFLFNFSTRLLYVLKKDEIQPGFIRVVIVCDIAHNDRIKTRHVSNLFISSIFLKQIRNSVISKH